VKNVRTGLVAIGLALVALVLACKSEGIIKIMQLGEPVRLKIAESGKLATDDLTITFKAVTNDSRCPLGVHCVVAGEADVVLTVEHGQSRQNITVKVGAGAANEATVEPYTIRILKLDPYPVIDQPIEDADRVIELQVDRIDE
jgi:hypothetical protein